MRSNKDLLMVHNLTEKLSLAIERVLWSKREVQEPRRFCTWKEFFSVFKEGEQLICANCKTTFYPEYLVLRMGALENKDRHVELKIPGSRVHWIWPVCSEDCQSLFGRRITRLRIEKEQEWAELQEAKSLVREAKALLKIYQNPPYPRNLEKQESQIQKTLPNS